MGETSTIEWTDATWNPWRGCDKVSPGCAHCYMFRDQERYGRNPAVVVRAAAGTFHAPLGRKWTLKAREIRAREQRPMRVFTCSWADFFHPDADAWRDDAWAIIRDRPEFDWQILTKRPELVADRLPADWGDGYPNVWLGVSIENRRFVGRADILRGLPAAVRFVSAEPLLGPLIPPHHLAVDDPDGGDEIVVPFWGDQAGAGGPDELDLDGIDWLIAGGESGPRHRPMRAQWVRDLRDACAHSGTAFFFKQWGGARPGGEALLDGRAHHAFPLTKAALAGVADAIDVLSRAGLSPMPAQQSESGA